ncbi:MAG TPA: YbhB/YbcL family Raf kinase inhibitor-like protein [Frankiaceae bacterium]|nr:YbhB/YbcL family Raf kinase inhibitor-like protein [Frankiaceae bacterium]
MSLRLRSDALEEGGFMPERYVHSGGNVAPPLDWDGAPPGVAEFVVTCEDLDATDAPDATAAGVGVAVGGRPFLHWSVTGLEGDLDGIGEGEDVEGTRYAVNGFDNAGYDGPEPPPGETHRYRFTVTAVSSPIEPDAGDVRDVMPARALDSATLTVRYSG